MRLALSKQARNDFSGGNLRNNVSETDLVGGRYDDPLKNVTYAVFRVGMKKTKLDPTFNFG